MSFTTPEYFFSISSELVVLDEAMPYDLFINSSSLENKERFVRIFPEGEILRARDLYRFKEKYFQLYVPETQRNRYLKSLVNTDVIDDVTKTTVIKDSAITYLGKLFDQDKEFSTEVLNECVQGCRDSVACMVDVIQNYDLDSLQDLIGKLSFHDFYTFDHSINVSMYCISIFKALNPQADNEAITLAGLGGMLHDLGKLKISTKIINNPGKLSDEDFTEIKRHPGYGLDLLSKGCDCEGVDIKVIMRIVYEHHENYNGTGYPEKIAGDDIHVLARVTAIADFFDAITTKRSYHDALSIEDAIAVMRHSVGKKIDPHIFEVFTKNVEDIAAQSKVRLADDFDPCQPHNVLPFEKIKDEDQSKTDFRAEKPKDFGKIRVIDKLKPKKKAG